MSPYRLDYTARLSEPAMRNPKLSVGGSTSTHSDCTCTSSCDVTSESTTKRIKCVFIGDAGVGKTNLIVSYTTNGYPCEYVPTAFDNYSVLVRVDNQPVQLQLCDTAGQMDFDHLRPLCYPNADVFVICFSVVAPTSFYDVQQRWIPEIKKHSPKTPFILVGTQSDQRANVSTILNLSQYGETAITELEAKEYAKEIKAFSYVECSALTQHNLKEVFDSVILAYMQISISAGSKISMQHFGGGRKSFKKLKEKIQRSNSVDATKHSNLQIRRQASNNRLHQVGLSPEKQAKKFSIHSAPSYSLYGSNTGLSHKVTPEKKDSNNSGKARNRWRRLLCMA